MLLNITVLLGADLFGFGDDPSDALRRSRAAAAESIAVQLSVIASGGDTEAMSRTVARFVQQNPDVIATSLVRENGTVVVQHGDVAALDADGTRIDVSLLVDRLPWGEVRIAFVPISPFRGEFLWFVFVACVSFTSFAAFLARVLVQLDPGRAVPKRVDTAFDLFSAGVVILDEKLRIVMANRAVAEIVGRPGKALVGEMMDGWRWHKEENWQAPWATTLHSGLAVSDQPLRLEEAGKVSRLFSVSCASVGGGEQQPRGVLVTLDDLTPIEQRNRDLSQAMEALQQSKEAIAEKNRELELLARTDPLTGLFNRRALVETLDTEVQRARRQGEPLACFMTDIDHFKSVNDTYGHAVGDTVIRAVADTLKAASRRYDTAGRYGGEEFVMVLPGLDAAMAAEVAERVRAAVFALGVGGKLGVPKLSSSFGVAELREDMGDGMEMVESADRALYVAKEGGRNRVVIDDPDAAPVESEASEKTTPREGAPPAESQVMVEAVAPSSEAELMEMRLLELEAELERSQRDLAVLREFDTLTGVPMRTLFLQRVEAEMVRSARTGRLVGVMSFELRGLERIVATLGHAAGDALVVAFVERLQKGLRSSDFVSKIAAEHNLSRIMSNEYGVLLSDLTDSAATMIVVTRLKRLLSQPFAISDERVYAGVNIGIALSELPSAPESVAGASTDASAADSLPDASELFAQAGEARIEAAAKPDKVSHSFASVALDDELHDYIRLEAGLRDALAAEALEVWYQPKFDLMVRRVTGMEALLRWRRDEREFVSPDVFIAVAEANGLIGDLSGFVLERTLRQIGVWNAMGFDDLHVAVNVSPMQFRAASLISDTLDALSRAGVPGRQLEIELTETSLLDRPDEACVALAELKAMGVSISMDDFGTGYTSLALLARLPLDSIKIDRSFITPMSDSERSRALVESIITMAHALKLRVVAEGVETNEELETLARFGCNAVQGYLISPPLPDTEVTDFLVRQRAAERLKRVS